MEDMPRTQETTRPGRSQNALESDLTNHLSRCQADDVRLKIAQNPILQSVNESMHRQLAAISPGLPKNCGTAKIADLEDHVDLAELIHAAGPDQRWIRSALDRFRRPRISARASC